MSKPFRKWLVARLLDTRWPRLCLNEEAIQKLAGELWIDPAALREVRAQYEAQMKKAGRQPSKGPKKGGTSHPQLELLMPEIVWKAWNDWCDDRAMKSPTALRSLVHAYLLGDQEPTLLDRRWKYKGEYLTVDKSSYREEGKRKPYPWREKALVTPGAMQALVRRTERLGVTRPTIMRGLVLDAIDGRFKDVRAVSATAMFDDPDRYWVPPERDGGKDED